jgi:sterol 24-C-methyltransferase
LTIVSPKYGPFASPVSLKTVGFEIEHEEDVQTYYPLEGDIRKAQTFWDYLTVWRMSWSGKLVSHNAMRLIEFVGLLPKGTWQVGEALNVAGDSLVKGGQTKVRTHRISYFRNGNVLQLFTPMYLVICRKPKN